MLEYNGKNWFGGQYFEEKIISDAVEWVRRTGAR